MSNELINLCPHPVVFYPPDCPDTVAMGQVTPLRLIDRERQPARMRTEQYDGEPVQSVGDGPAQVEVHRVGFDPRQITGLPEPTPQIHYIVSLPIALALPERDDLLVPWREVRNRSGTVIGCRGLCRASLLTDGAA